MVLTSDRDTYSGLHELKAALVSLACPSHLVRQRRPALGEDSKENAYDFEPFVNEDSSAKRQGGNRGPAKVSNQRKHLINRSLFPAISPGRRATEGPKTCSRLRLG